MGHGMTAPAALLAPHGVLRIALNHANFLLVSTPAPHATGVAPDLGHELARRLGATAAFVGYEHAGLVADAAARDEWDVAFIGADPARAGTVAFTPPYVEIEATYLVPPGSHITTIEDVDRPGVRIAVADRSAYHLQLQRTIRHATLVPAEGLAGSGELFRREGLEVLSGLRPRLLVEAAQMPGARILDGRFMSVQQAMGLPRAKAAALPWLHAVAHEMTASGMVAGLIARHGAAGLTVVPVPAAG